MLGRRNVEALINEIIAKLNGYLSNHSHMILTDRQLKDGYFQTYTDGSRKRHDYSYWAQCNDGKYIVFPYEVSDRNSALTLNRMKNIYNIRLTLIDHLAALREEKLEELNKRIDMIHSLLDTGLMDNKKLSNDYGVTHITYEDGRLAGHGIFASWCNSTWTQSRAGRVLEKSMSLLDSFKCKFVVQALPISIPSAPPAYAVSIGVSDSGCVKPAKKI